MTSAQKKAMVAQAYPRPLIEGGFQAHRPEDIAPGDEGEAVGGPQRSLLGVASEAADSVDVHAFLPTRFLSKVTKVDETQESLEENREASQHQGEYPWRTMKWISAWMSVAWFLSAIFDMYFFVFPQGLVITPFVEEEQEKEEKEADENKEGLEGYIKKYELPDWMAAQPRNEEPTGWKVNLQWPSSDFYPMQLSCTADGNFIVADHFSIWRGHFPHESATAERYHRPLTLTPLPLCEVLEGAEIADVSLHCCHSDCSAAGVLATSSSNCTAMVLPTQRGRQAGQGEILLCPGTAQQLDEHHKLAAEDWGSIDTEEESVSGTVWRTAGGWLAALGDRMASLATTATSCPCTPDALSKQGVVVGTESGHVVGLTGHAAGTSMQLSPGFSWQSDIVRNHSLHMASQDHLVGVDESGHVVMLRVADGEVLSRWQLPGHLRWQSVCGGRNGHEFYALGWPQVNLSDVNAWHQLLGVEPEIWRFDLHHAKTTSTSS